MQEMVGWVLAALAVIVPVGIYLKERRTQRIQYSVLDARPLLTANARFPLEIRHGGVVVGQPTLVVWRLTNAGNNPIRPPDYEEPLTMSLRGARILSSDITFSRPQDFAPAITSQSEHRVVLEPRLMNPRDLVEVQMLVDGTPTDTQVSGRVAGIPRLERVTLPRTSGDQVWEFSMLDTLIVVFLGFAGAAYGIFMFLQSSIVAQVMGALIACVFIFYYPLRIRRAILKNRLFLGR